MKKAIVAMLFLASLGVTAVAGVRTPAPVPVPLPQPRLDCGCGSDYECLFGGFGCGNSYTCIRLHGPCGAGICGTIAR